MDYKKMIIEMVNQINNEKALVLIRDFVSVPYDRENPKKNKKEEREN